MGEMLSMTLEENLAVRGGGVMSVNKMILNAANITVDVEGVINSDGLGYKAGSGPGVGLIGNSSFGGSGASHGGLGGQGSDHKAASSAYGNCNQPSDPGSGGALMTEGQTDGAGGGVINLFASGQILLDGDVKASGGDAITPGTGGGSGGSVVIEAPIITGT